MMMYKMSTTIGIYKKMKTRQGMDKFFYILSMLLLSLLIPLVILLFSLEMNSTDEAFYRNFQVENKINEEIGKSQEELDLISKDLISYLKYGENSYLEAHFNQREVSHMEDVFALFELARRVRNIWLTVIVLILVLANYKYFLNDLLYSSLKLMALLVVVYVGIGIFLSLNFDEYFIKFHELFFDNDLWLLDPKTDMMINILPIEFFILMARRIFTRAIAGLLLVCGLIFANEKYFRSKRKGCLECSIQEAQ